MLIAILVLLLLSISVNILQVLALARIREVLELKLDHIQGKVDRLHTNDKTLAENDKAIVTDVRQLTAQLLARLPPLPYGVELESRQPGLTIGPYDSRIPG